MTNRPFITISYAQSLDGCIAALSKQRLILSCRESLRLTHELRAENDAVLVGIGTVLADNPRLSVRYSAGKDPLPIVLDSHLRTPPDARLFKTGRPLLIASTRTAKKERRKRLEQEGAGILSLPADASGRVDLRALLAELAGIGIDRLMVEGGARVISSFLEARTADRLVVTVAPVLVGGLEAVGRGRKVHDLPLLHNVSRELIGHDFILRADLKWGKR